MNGLNKSEKILLSLLAVVLVGYVYYNFIITPLTSKIKTVQSSITSYEGKLNTSKLMAASNKKMTADIENLKVNYNNYLKLMPKSTMTAQIERDINKFANDNNVSLSNLTIGKEIEYNKQTNGVNGNTAVNGNANTNNAAQVNNKQNSSTNTVAQKIMAVPIAINITGNFNSFTAFINSLETTGRITSIASVNVATQGTDTSGDKLTVTLNASMLYIQDGTTAQNNYDFNNGNYSKINPFK